MDEDIDYGPALTDNDSGSEDSYEREDLEQRLYSQIYHDTSGCPEKAYVESYGENNELEKFPVQEQSDTLIGSCLASAQNRQNNEGTKRNSGQKRLRLAAHSNDDFDIEVVKEVVVITEDPSDSDTRKKSSKKLANTSKRSSKKILLPSRSSSDNNDEEVPFWARLDSGTHETDTALDVHIRTHGRQRHDSILSHTSSALGDDPTHPLVPLYGTKNSSNITSWTSLEDVLSQLPKDGWDILRTDYKVSSLGHKRSLRYHNLKCRNCDETGHISSACPLPKKQKACSLCSEVHKRAKDRRQCPHTHCIWCLEPGHSSRVCREAKMLRSTWCERCRHRGHKSKACHELWRQWHSTTEQKADSISPLIHRSSCRLKDVYCANCGHAGHAAHECKSTVWYQTPILPPYVVHYTNFGEVKDFGKPLIKRPARRKPEDFDYPRSNHNMGRGQDRYNTERSQDHYNTRQSHDLYNRRWGQDNYNTEQSHDHYKTEQGEESELFTIPKHLLKKRGVKHKQSLDAEGNPRNKRKKSAPPLDITDSLSQKPQTKKQKKLEKHLAMRDGPVVNSKKTHSKTKPKAKFSEVNEPSTSRLKPKTSTKVKPTKSERKARKRLKEQLGILPSHCAPVNDTKASNKALKNKKSNNRKRIRHAYRTAGEGKEGASEGKPSSSAKRDGVGSGTRWFMSY